VSDKHTVAEQRHLNRVATLTCAVCFRLNWNTPCQEIHHVLGDDGRRIGHGVVLPMCNPHHQGKDGIWDKPAFERQFKFTEMDLLNDTILRLA